MSEITAILQKINSGADPNAAEELLSLVYKELHDLAVGKMKKERPGHTLQATLLVNDAWMKLFPGEQKANFEGRAHFFGSAAKVMHRILVDHARRRDAQKRGKKMEMSETQFSELSHPAPDDVILAVDEALKKFGATDEKTAKLVELRFFVGLNMKDAAESLGISMRSGERDCAYFMAWFRREFGKELNI